jgi:hypothetical protein
VTEDDHGRAPWVTPEFEVIASDGGTVIAVQGQTSPDDDVNSS